MVPPANRTEGGKGGKVVLVQQSILDLRLIACRRGRTERRKEEERSSLFTLAKEKREREKKKGDVGGAWTRA